MGNVDGSFEAARVLHAETGGGPLATHSVPSYAWEKLSTAELESLGLTELIRQGRAGQSHVEYIVETFWFPPTPTPQGLSPRKRESYISLTSQAMTPLSIGNVTLRSNQIVEPLMINPAVCGPTSSASTLIVSCSTLPLQRTCNWPCAHSRSYGRPSPRKRSRISLSGLITARLHQVHQFKVTRISCSEWSTSTTSLPLPPPPV